jgi:hypothetical protein
VKEVFKAIVDASVGHALATALTGGFHNTEAPVNTVRPYAVFSMVGNNKDRTFSSIHKRLLIQIQLCSKSTSPVEVNNLYASLLDMLDETELAIVGWGCVDCQEEQSVLFKKEDTWIYSCTFVITVSTSIPEKDVSQIWDIMSLT